MVIGMAACATTKYGGELQPPRVPLPGAPEAPASHLRVDTARHEVVMTAGPFRIQKAMADEAGAMDHGGHGGHDSSMKTPLVPLVWPVDGGLLGFRLGLFSGDGTPLPRTLIHHMNTLNFDRRELLYPVPTRLVAIGSETPDIKLPASHQILLERGDSLGWYIMWNNDTGADLEDVYVELVLPYGDPEATASPLTTLYLDTNLQIGENTSFDVPPGRFEKSFAFETPVSGQLLAAGGHVHDYGVELRLEDVETESVIFRLEVDRNADGSVTSVEQKIFRRFFGLFDASIPLQANHAYRIVGVYDNPTGQTIPEGGMAQIGALFRPDDTAAWPQNDRTDPAYQVDVSGLPEPLADNRRPPR